MHDINKIGPTPMLRPEVWGKKCSLMVSRERFLLTCWHT